jgi:hypothetical protein
MDEQSVLRAVNWPRERSRDFGHVTWTASHYDSQDPAEALDATQVRATRSERSVEVHAVSIGRSGEANSLAFIRYEAEPFSPQSWRVARATLGDPPTPVSARLAHESIEAMREELDPFGRFRSLDDRPAPTAYPVPFEAPGY